VHQLNMQCVHCRLSISNPHLVQPKRLTGCRNDVLRYARLPANVGGEGKYNPPWLVNKPDLTSTSTARRTWNRAGPCGWQVPGYVSVEQEMSAEEVPLCSRLVEQRGTTLLYAKGKFRVS
jgi:hypothetical protein